MTAWWSALAPVTWPVVCAGQNHEIRWADGAIAAPAHPDAERERALAALGADPSPCLQIVDAWNRHADDLDVLVLASRGPSDRLDESRLHFMSHAMGRAGLVPHGVVTRMVGYSALSSARPASVGWVGFRPSGRRGYVDYEDEVPADALASLLALGSALPHRLTATVIAAWADRIDANDDRVAAAMPALDAALYGRMRATLLPWLGSPAKIEFTMQPPGAEPAVHRDGEVIHAELPFAWLRDVWVYGLTVVLDRFCLQADPQAPGAWTLATVSRDLSGAQTLTISG
jgi:hypothetical protein